MNHNSNKEITGGIVMNNNITRVVTNEVVLINPHLITPSDKYGYPQYITGIILYRDDIETIKKTKMAINEAIKRGNFKDLNNLKLPLKSGEKEYPGNELYQNSYFFYATSKIAPCVINTDGRRNFGRTPIQNGDYARVSINFTPYSKGVYCQLYNVKLLGRSRYEELRPNPADDFR